MKSIDAARRIAFLKSIDAEHKHERASNQTQLMRPQLVQRHVLAPMDDNGTKAKEHARERLGKLKAKGSNDGRGS